MTKSPCGMAKDYIDCCGQFISEKHTPRTPEQLMRSRYTAYNQAAIDYIESTMKAPANLYFKAKEARAWAKRLSSAN